jgi:hypothetical protein
LISEGIKAEYTTALCEFLLGGFAWGFDEVRPGPMPSGREE